LVSPSSACGKLCREGGSKAAILPPTMRVIPWFRRHNRDDSPFASLLGTLVRQEPRALICGFLEVLGAFSHMLPSTLSLNRPMLQSPTPDGRDKRRALACLAA